MRDSEVPKQLTGPEATMSKPFPLMTTPASMVREQSSGTGHIVNEVVRAVDKAPRPTDFTGHFADAHGEKVYNVFRFVRIIAHDGHRFVGSPGENWSESDHKVIGLSLWNGEVGFND